MNTQKLSIRVSQQHKELSATAKLRQAQADEVRRLRLLKLMMIAHGLAR